MNFDSSNKAIYLQIVDRISDSILSGEFGEDQRLPSVREYAASMEVNANTAMRAYEKLSDKGLIYNRRGIGFFVSPGAKMKVISERGDELVNSKLDSMFDLLHHLGITPDSLKKAYEDFLAAKNSRKEQ